ERPWSLLRERLPGAAYVAASEARRKLVAKALKIAQKDVVTVPDGVDVREFLELTPNVRELDRELGLVEADAVLLTPTRLVEHKGLHRGLEIVRALSKARRGLSVRWLVTGALDPHRPATHPLRDEFLARRDKLKLADPVRVLTAECEWARGQVPDADLRALYRLADALFLPSVDAGFGMPVLEAALARNLLVLGPAPALAELARGEKGIVKLGPRQTPAQAAGRILAALDALPASGLRRRVRRELDWDVIARDFLVPLVEGERPGAAKRRSGRRAR
ncbi:MAG: glycosyltransferase family 4 protein, partial [Planctomycetota bacterium]